MSYARRSVVQAMDIKKLKENILKRMIKVTKKQ